MKLLDDKCYVAIGEIDVYGTDPVQRAGILYVRFGKDSSDEDKERTIAFGDQMITELGPMNVARSFQIQDKESDHFLEFLGQRPRCTDSKKSKYELMDPETLELKETQVTENEKFESKVPDEKVYLFKGSDEGLFCMGKERQLDIFSIGILYDEKFCRSSTVAPYRALPAFLMKNLQKAPPKEVTYDVKVQGSPEKNQRISVPGDITEDPKLLAQYFGDTLNLPYVPIVLNEGEKNGVAQVFLEVPMIDVSVTFEDDEAEQLPRKLLIPAHKNSEKDLVEEVREKLLLEFTPDLVSRKKLEEKEEVILKRPLTTHSFFFEHSPEEVKNFLVPHVVSDDKSKLAHFAKEKLNLKFFPEVVHSSKKNGKVETVLRVPKLSTTMTIGDETFMLDIPADLFDDENKLKEYLKEKLDLEDLPDLLSKEKDGEAKMKLKLGKPEDNHVVSFEDEPEINFNYKVPKDCSKDKEKLSHFLKEKMGLEYTPIVESVTPQSNGGVVTILRKPQVPHTFFFKEDPLKEHKYMVPVDKVKDVYLAELLKQKLGLEFVPLVENSEKLPSGEVRVEVRKPTNVHIVTFEDNPEEHKIPISVDIEKDEKLLCEDFEKKLGLSFTPVIISMEKVSEKETETVLGKGELNYLVCFDHSEKMELVTIAGKEVKNNETFSQALKEKLGLNYKPEILSTKPSSKQYEGKRVNFEAFLSIPKLHTTISLGDETFMLDIPVPSSLSKSEKAFLCLSNSLLGPCS